MFFELALISHFQDGEILIQIGNHERDLVSFSFLVRNGGSREKRDIVNSREK
jgi:hypothetical protein